MKSRKGPYREAENMVYWESYCKMGRGPSQSEKADDIFQFEKPGVGQRNLRKNPLRSPFVLFQGERNSFGDANRKWLVQEQR